MANEVWIGSTNATNAFTATANWLPTNVPTTGDTVYFNESAVGGISCTTGEDHSAVVLAALHQNMNFMSSIGSSGNPLKISSSQVYLGEPSMSGINGAGSGRINLNTDTTSSSIYCYGSSSSSTDTGKEPIRLKCNNTNNSITVAGGLVGIATDSIGDTATLGTLVVTGGTAHVGPGSTITTIDISGGQCDVGAAVTAINVSAGILNTKGDFAIATLSAYGGTVNAGHRKASAGNEIGTLNLYNAAIDFSKDSASVVIGTLNYWGNCRIICNKANIAHVAFTLGTQAGVLTIDAQ